jgi:nucleoside-diphosphate-sugar epimerase
VKNLRENKSIFITGASGFLGKNFLNFLSTKKKYKNIYCLSRAKKKNFKNIKWIKGYLEDNFDKYLKNTNLFFHFASSLNEKSQNLNNYIKFDFYSSFQALNNARVNGVKNFFIAGSAFEYGFSDKKIDNSYKILSPINDYSMTKILFFMLVFWWSKKYKLNVTYGRIFQMYGRYEKKNRLYPYIVNMAKKNSKIHLNNPFSKRNFVAVEEVCEKIYDSVNKKTGFKIINICSGSENNLSNFDFANKIWKKNSITKPRIFFNSNKNIRKNKQNIFGDFFEKNYSFKDFLIKIKL